MLTLILFLHGKNYIFQNIFSEKSVSVTHFHKALQILASDTVGPLAACACTSCIITRMVLTLCTA